MTVFEIREGNGGPGTTSTPTKSTVSGDGESSIAKSGVKLGMITDVKNLYQGKPDSRGRSAWVDKYPDDLEEAAENADSARYALLIRNKKCYDGRKNLEIDSIVVQSPLLKTILGKVLKDYPGITTGLDRLTFSAPFEPFVHRWDHLAAALKDEHDVETKGHLGLFYRILEVELSDKIKARDDFIAHNVITFEHIWMIFEPGCIVYSMEDEQDCAARLLGGRYAETRCGPIYSLNCQNIDWDGEYFGYGAETYKIPAFAGTTPITNLSTYPLDKHPCLAKIKAKLIERGRVFEQLSGYHYKAYQGIAIGQGMWGPIKYNVDSRIIIDTYAWNRFNPNRQVSLSSLGNKVATPVNNDYESNDDYDDDDDEYDDDNNYDGSVQRSSHAIAKTASEKPALNLTKEQLLLCSATLKGYSLKNKKWLTFFIDGVEDIKWNARAFESLVLPSDHKELILALTESQVQNKETFDDVIHGKGKGIIMLLSGPPGVGKTLTAESVAETMHTPLYMMSAADLGLNSSGVESSLSNVLEMSTKWNAVLLLDEADVFLEQRSTHDLERNKLVSIFLRILEYYEGILFLTTNRVENIDAAFQSRIHISMEYNELSLSSRRHVWSNFLASSPSAHGFTDNDLDNLAQFPMNGREIKNVLKTAQLLASRKNESLKYEHVEIVLSIEKRHAKKREVISDDAEVESTKG